MAASLRDIQVLRSVLGRLDAERPAKRPSPPDDWTPRNVYHDRGGDFRRRLLLGVESRPGNARILVTGQIGVGKSSELQDFRAEDLSVPIFCDLEKEASPERCGPTGLFLTLPRDCWAKVRTFTRDHRHGPPEEIRDQILIRLVDWLRGTLAGDDSTIVFSFGGMDSPIPMADKSRAVEIILRKAALHESIAEPSERFDLAPDALVILLNTLLDWFASRCSGLPPLLIIDHVDKIRGRTVAEDVLVKSFPQWDRLHASIIMIAPIEYTIGSLVGKGPR
jgi:hypothetical protein